MQFLILIMYPSMVFLSLFLQYLIGKSVENSFLKAVENKWRESVERKSADRKKACLKIKSRFGTFLYNGLSLEELEFLSHASPLYDRTGKELSPNEILSFYKNSKLQFEKERNKVN